MPSKDAIEHIYDAAFDDEAFARVPEVCAQIGGGRSSVVQFFSQEWELTHYLRAYFSEAMDADYIAHFADEDIWIQQVPFLTSGEIRLLDERVPVPQFERSIFYNEFFRAHGDDTNSCLGGWMQTGSGRLTIGVHRGRGQSAFDEADRLRLQRLTSHLARLQAIRHRIKSAEERAAVAKGALDRFADAALVVGHDRKLLVANAAAETLLRRGGFTVMRGRIHAARAQDDRHFGALVQAAVATPAAAGAMLVARSEQRHYRIIVSPIPSRRAALVLIEAPDAENVGLGGHLIQMFKLSPAEAALAEAIVAGERLDRFAERRGVGLTTVRSQLQAIFRKTDTGRQSELIAFLARLPHLRPPQ